MDVFFLGGVIIFQFHLKNLYFDFLHRKKNNEHAYISKKHLGIFATVSDKRRQKCSN